jgi:hypothetical protein
MRYAAQGTKKPQKSRVRNLKKADDKAYPFLIGVSRLQHGGKRGKPGSPNHRALMPVYAI